MKKEVCKICNKNDFVIKKGYLSSRLDNFINYDLFKCVNCGTYTTDIAKVDFKNLYDEVYYKESFLSKIISFITSYLIYFRIIQNNKKSLKILDFGAGSGAFINYVKQNTNLEAYGIETSEKAFQHLFNIHGNKVSNANILSQSFFENKKFDAITLFHVLEHLEDPKEYLNKLISKLNKGGLLLIEVPNINSLESILFKKYFFHLDLPRHLYHFNKNSLSYLLNKTDLEEIKFVFSFSFLSFLLCPIYSYENYIKTRKKVYQRISLNLLKIIFFPLIILFSIITRIFNIGPSISVICKK